MGMYTLLYLKWITTGTCCIARGTLLSVMWQFEWEGVWGRMDTCICMAESLHCSPETITVLLITYTPIENKKCNLKKFLKTIIFLLNPVYSLAKPTKVVNRQCIPVRLCNASSPEGRPPPSLTQAWVFADSVLVCSDVFNQGSFLSSPDPLPTIICPQRTRPSFSHLIPNHAVSDR